MYVADLDSEWDYLFMSFLQLFAIFHKHYS